MILINDNTTVVVLMVHDEIESDINLRHANKKQHYNILKVHRTLYTKKLYTI